MPEVSNDSGHETDDAVNDDVESGVGDTEAVHSILTDFIRYTRNTQKCSLSGDQRY